MISRKYSNDGVAHVELNDVQRRALAIFRDDLEKGFFQFEEYDCECGCRSSRLIELAQKDRYGIPVSTKICPDCGLVMTDPRMTQDSYDLFYDSVYRSIYVGTEKPGDSFFEEEEEIGKEIWNFVAASIDMSEIQTVLEIGCGAGGILSVFKERGKNVKGIDIGGEYIEFGKSKGVNIEKEHSTQHAKKNTQYDLIILNHVLEHFLDLETELNAVRKLLKDDGVLYVAVPGLFNLGVYNYDFLRYLQNAHVRHFCSGTLEMVMNKYGFRMLRCNESVKAIFKYVGDEDADYIHKNNFMPQELLYLGSCENKCGNNVEPANCVSENLKDLLRYVEGKDVLCYGAGKYGKIVYSYLKQNKLEPQGFIVSNKIDTKGPFGKVVYELDDIGNDTSKCILITVSDRFVDEIVSIVRGKCKLDYFIVNEHIMSEIKEEVISKNTQLQAVEMDRSRCFILGTGPTIKKQNLKKLKKEVVFSCSFCSLLDEYKDIDPLFYVTPALTNDREGPDYCVEKMRFLNDTVTSPFIIADYEDYSLIVGNGFFCEKKLFFVDQSCSEWTDLFERTCDLTQATPAIQSSSIMMIKVALYIGFRDIYLLGLEHDFMENESYEHAYDFNRLGKCGYEKLMHMMSIHNSKGEGVKFSYESRINVYSTLIHQYRALKKISHDRGTNVYNSSLYSKLGVFEMKNLEDIS